MYYLQCWTVEAVDKNLRIYMRKAREKVWRAANKERVQASRLKWRAESKNKEIESVGAAEYRKNNKDKISQKRREKNQNPAFSEKKKKNDREYRRSEHGKAIARLYRQNRTKKDPFFRLIRSLRSRAKSIFKSKRGKAAKFFGCSLQSLKGHVEKQFSEDMNWANYGKCWNLDHILPIAWAQSANEFFMLNHWANLRPLKVDNNFSKGDSPPDFIPEGYPYWQHFLDCF